MVNTLMEQVRTARVSLWDIRRDCIGSRWGFMLVPKFWAEARVQHRAGRKQVTVRRYGWSDASQQEAQANADARAKEALARILAGEKLHRRDHKIPYNGAEGLPIREEILSTHGDAVITRNSYGAHCLNTPSVLFADIDFPSRSTGPGTPPRRFSPSCSQRSPINGSGAATLAVRGRPGEGCCS